MRWSCNTEKGGREGEWEGGLGERGCITPGQAAYLQSKYVLAHYSQSKYVQADYLQSSYVQGD